MLNTQHHDIDVMKYRYFEWLKWGRKKFFRSDYLTAQFNPFVISEKRNFRDDPMLIATGDRTSSDDYKLKIHQGQAVYLGQFTRYRRQHGCASDFVAEAIWTASGSFSILFRFTSCTTSRKFPSTNLHHLITHHSV